MTALTVTRTTDRDDLHRLVDDINQANWDEANAISTYEANALAAYLQRQDTVFITCYEHTDNTTVLLGMASASLQLKPYGNELWLYVDEVDVCADQRCRGAGKAMMHKLLEIARDAGCEELWLGTETDNQAANALYRSLDPDEVEDVIGYTFETDEQDD